MKTGITQGVHKIGGWQWKDHNSAAYYIADGCYDPACGLQIDFMAEAHSIEMNLYAKLGWWEHNDWWFGKRWWTRIKVAARVLFRGEYDWEGWYCWTDTEHVKAIIRSMEEGLEIMQNGTAPPRPHPA